MNRRLRLMAGLAGLSALCAAGCGSTDKQDSTAPAAHPETQAAELTVQPGEYAAAFDAARHVLRDRGFTLERVDAQSGVIMTRPKGTAGLASPWDQEQSRSRQEFDDLNHRRNRTVRVEFEPAQAAQPSGPAWSAPSHEGPLVMRIRVVVSRVHQPGWRISSLSTRLNSYSSDPALAARGMEPVYSVAVDEDRALAQRLVKDVAGAIGQ